MTDTRLQGILAETVQICKMAGEFQLTHFQQVKPGQIADKGLNQLVSFVDVETEKMLVSGLSSLMPEAGFVTEESTIATNNAKEFTWIIDPLDGTTNFLHGLPAWCISVALTQNNQPVLGIVYIPVWNEMFTSIAGNGTLLNGMPVSVTKTKNLSDSLLATGFPYYEFEYMEPYLQLLRHFMKNTHGLRRMGSAAIDLAYTACGRFDGFFELGLNAWDVAAGALMVKEAGGIVSDFNAGENFLFGKTILASNSGLSEELLQNIQMHFKH